jgi:hypothetical protein
MDIKMRGDESASPKEISRKLFRRLNCICTLISSAILLLVALPGANAQTDLTAITGTVTDSTGAVVPGSQVVAKNIGTNAIRISTTNANGNFSMALMPVGTYELTASAAGFQEARSKIDVLLTGATANLQLNVAGSSSQITVDVSSAHVQLEMSSHDVSNVVGSVQLTTLPNSGRNILNTATLGPATQSASDTNGNTGDIGFFNQTSNAVYIAGLDNYHTSYLQDGIENINLLDQTANILASVEASQEVSTILSNAPARFAEPSVINVITKSGTNHFHGAAYDFFQNDAFNARSWSNRLLPVERYNLFGANLGGPILKNKVFGFFDYSGLRDSTATPFNGRVPTLAERSGDFTGDPIIYDPATYDPATGSTSPFDKNMILPGRFNSFSNLWMVNYPQPNQPLSGGFNYQTNLPSTNNYDQYLGRVDWNISTNNQIFGSFAKNNGINLSQTITPGLFGIQFTAQGLNVAVAETATFGPNVVNVIKFGYDRSIVNRTQQGVGLKNYAQYYGLNGLDATPEEWAPPTVAVTNMTGLGDPYSPQGATQNRFQYADEVNWRIRNHSVSIGGEFVQTMFDAYWVVNNNGNYSFTGNATAQYSGGARTLGTGFGFADLLLGYPGSATAAVGVSADPFRGLSTNGYVQDDWKISPSLTLNFGLRYDFAQAPYDKNGHSGLYSVQLRQVVPGTFKSNFGDWGPRIGFSWGFMKNVVLRGGYGIYYAGNQWEDLQFQLLYSPNVVQKSYAFTIQNQLPIQNAISATGTGSALESPFTMDNPFKDPNVQEWNLNIQQSLGANTLFTIGYLGNSSRHVEGRADLNQAYALSPGNTSGILDVTPDPTIAFAYAETSRGIANFNSLITTLDRHFTKGLQFLASYTWSKSMDLWDGDNGAMQTIYHPRYTYAPAGWDRTNNFTLSGTYALPIGPGEQFVNSNNWLNRMIIGGWQVSGVYHIASGQPINITANNNADFSAYVTVEANNVCNSTGSFQRTRLQIFDPACFVQPANGQYGIGGRNSVREPRLNIADISISKAFRFTEHHQLEFRSEAFNAFNHPNLLASGGAVGNAGLGTLTSSPTRRIAQFGLRYSF